MIVTPGDADIALAKRTHSEYAAKAGSENIATEFALACLSALLKEVRPATVLEFGAGIGTITSFLLSHPVNVERVFCTEDHAFCLEQLALNLPENSGDRVKIMSAPDQLAEVDRKIDLLIVDGGFDGNLAQPFDYVEQGTVCYFEGVRRDSREAMVGALSKKGLVCNVDNNRPSGRRLWTSRWTDRRIAGIPIPKIRIFHLVKGCWIGETTAANASTI